MYPGTLVEADQYFVGPDGEYRFDGSKLGEAHRWCHQETERLLAKGEDVVVANTFVIRRELRPYHQLATKYGAHINVVRAKGDYGSIHGVSKKKADEYDARFEQGYSEQNDIEGYVVSIPRYNPSEVVFCVKSTGSDALKYYVKATRDLVPVLPAVGEVWDIKGCLIPDPYFDEVFVADDCDRLMPMGRNLILFLALNNRFPGINSRIADSLYFAFGDQLGEVLEQGNVEAISYKGGRLLSAPIVEMLVEGWQEYCFEFRVMEWLRSCNANPILAKKIVGFWGKKAIEKISDDPYRLLAFKSWKEVDQLANAIGILGNDKRRIAAAVETVCYFYYDNGHTAVQLDALENDIEQLLGVPVQIEDALTTCQDRIVEWKDRDLVQLEWAFVVEQHVQKEILERAKMLEKGQALLTVEFDENRLNKFVETVGYPLNSEQLKAVRTVLENPVSCIFGGLGVCKSHILKAIFDQIGDRATIYFLALTGLATKRRQELTGIEPISIGKFLKKLDEGGIAQNAWLFIDEANALDVAVAYRVLKKLPRTVRICFIGDSYRFFPKGPGLVFHAMEGVMHIPQVELVTMHPPELETGIPQVANAIRSLTFPEIENFVGLRKRKVGVSFLESTCVETTVQNILRVYRESKEYGDVQIVAATNGICEHLNQALHKEHRELREYQSLETPVLNLQNCNALTGSEEVTVGDPVLWHSMSDHSRDLFDGMLGIVTEIFERHIWDITDDGLEVRYVAKIDFEGRLVNVHESDLANISLGYAITCNEIQDSQFERVIVAVAETGDNRVIDNSWLYTAVTSAQKQVVLVGDKGVFAREVTTPPRAFDRIVGLKFN
ncbi:hypothetical protein A7E78_04775 [Syntrophotalea acetylenivorans]|uniref:Uncharacterized protein n=2 Tax=Syntrophotalea acetylenivorans TaxID=1842532 RepID=A0A1L3GMQ0_9BACT|nr:hypothetical protein A7E78_04775 [Syntrophotalea acetylenivorans]